MDLAENIQLSAPIRRQTSSVPKVGGLVQVRSRRWLVNEVIEPKTLGQTCVVRLSCADDDAQGQSLEVLWDYELDRFDSRGRRLGRPRGQGLRPAAPVCGVSAFAPVELRNCHRPLGLGGQASLQWTPADVDPVQIILKAFDLGINYFDTSNAYGPSQSNLGKAFRELHLIPGQPGYNESLRRSIFLTSKTGLRWAKGGWTKEGLRSFSNGPRGSTAVDDLKRGLTQIFGDGQGNYPPGAHLDMILTHNVTTMEEVEALYEGLDHPDPGAENIGALAALRDYRDGTNLTGLNPKQEKLVRHIGFSGHHSPAVMMEMIQRDERDLLEGMLVAINANDRLNFNMQYNVIPVAVAKNMGLIAMKVFADGAMYTKDATWSNRPENVIRKVGSDALPSQPLVEYTLSTPGIHTAIIGTGQIDADPKSCQLRQNLSAAQILPAGLSVSDRRAIERITNAIKNGRTNYFQEPRQALTAPREPSAEQEMRGHQRVVRLQWQTAFAGDEPIARYDIWRDQQKISQVTHQPQISKKPFLFEELVKDKAAHTYQIKAVDTVSRVAATEGLLTPNVA